MIEYPALQIPKESFYLRTRVAATEEGPNRVPTLETFREHPTIYKMRHLTANSNLQHH